MEKIRIGLLVIVFATLAIIASPSALAAGDNPCNGVMDTNCVMTDNRGNQTGCGLWVASVCIYGNSVPVL